MYVRTYVRTYSQVTIHTNLLKSSSYLCELVKNKSHQSKKLCVPLVFLIMHFCTCVFCCIFPSKMNTYIGVRLVFFATLHRHRPRRRRRRRHGARHRARRRAGCRRRRRARHRARCNGRCRRRRRRRAGHTARRRARCRRRGRSSRRARHSFDQFAESTRKIAKDWCEL